MSFFSPEMLPDDEYATHRAKSIPTFWVFRWRSRSNIDEVTVHQFYELTFEAEDVIWTAWTQMFTGLVTYTWWICTQSLITMCRFVSQLSWKCRDFDYKSITEADFDVTLWCHRWRNWMNDSFSSLICSSSFYFWCQIEAMFNFRVF